MLIGLLFPGSIRILFIGPVGEYILSGSQRAMKRPLVMEQEHISFAPEKEISGTEEAK